VVEVKTILNHGEPNRAENNYGRGALSLMKTMVTLLSRKRMRFQSERSGTLILSHLVIEI